MSVLRTIENKIEGLFEGVFGRAFRTHVQPVELARKLAKEMDEHRSVSVSRVYVPNEYTVYLSSADRQQFASYEGSLVGELQEYLTEHARREAYALLTPPRVLFATDDDLTVGEFGIATRVAQPEDGVPPLPAPAPPEQIPPRSVSIPSDSMPDPVSPSAPVPQPTPSATMIYRQHEPEAELPDSTPPPEPDREIVTLTLDGRAHPITSRTVVIGRSRECDLRVVDGNASRRHAEVVQEGSTYVVVDLGSTNGTELNGKRITREKLHDGDRITIGATNLVFGRAHP
jgi:pSer/pThr/pTyr-binding forkhead associated (FHA) protein